MTSGWGRCVQDAVVCLVHAVGRALIHHVHVHVHMAEGLGRMDPLPPNTSYDIQSDENTQSEETDRLIEGEEWIYSVLDPAGASKRSDHQTNAFDTLVHLVKASIGTGLLALPLAVKNAGLVVGGVSLFLLGIIATHCMFILVNVARKMTSRYPEYKTLNYSQVTEVAVSQYVHKKLVIKLSGAIVNLFLIITQFGFCCVYFVFIADNLNQVFCSAFGVILAADRYHATQAWIAVIFLPLVMFCWIRNFNSLSSFSTVANIFIFFCLGVIFYEEVHLFVSSDPKHQAAIIRPRNVTDSDGNGGGVELYPTQLTTAALFFGNAIYSFEGIGMILPLENKIANPKHFKPTLWLGMIIVIFLYVSVGVFGYAAYGASIKASITLNLELRYNDIVESVIFLIVRLLYAYIIFASFLLQFYVPMDFLEPPFLRLLNRLLFNRWKCSLHHQDKLNTLSWIIFRTMIVLIIAAIAVGLPDLGDLIALVGAVASSALALIFPPLLNMLVFVKDDSLPSGSSSSTKKPGDTSIQNIQYRQSSIRSSLSILYRVVWVTKDVLIMVLGVVGLGFGTYAAINGLVTFLKKDSSVANTCVDFFPH